MSLPAALPAAILDTLVGRLAFLFLLGAAGDLVAARDAARQMLAAYDPRTEDELRLAANIVSFSFHALEALSQSAHPEMSLTKILRLRGSAVSLSRESHKAERRLDQLQKARRAGAQPQPDAPDAPQAAIEPTHPRIDNAIALIEATRQAIETTGKTTGKTGGKTWTQSYHQRQTARRISDNLKKNQAAHAASVAAAPAA